MPKSLALPEGVTRVDVIAVGRARLITPAGEAWDSWFDGPSVTADFMDEREQPAEQKREAFDAQVHARHQHLHFRHQT
ncbi:AbrB/MazE/SpoVT family DNA-binding domain-containing protein [Halomonas aquamarina]|uniref:AbrB/MazE/SpoVT family DNA-binding domain-containing protein n=2 Tax=Vreelandella aquamarina TaxID=77097 RepID=A0ACC5VSC7_9GAMM|nr:AbrB/MazE/SpoVT family DNA-binding domain-containing protein [Halomonas aquamarina]